MSILVEAFVESPDVGGEDACVCAWKSLRIPPMWGEKTHVFVRASV